MHHAIQSDSQWFRNHPTAIVRFRRESSGEFEALLSQGDQPPTFRPSFSHLDAPLNWVAVVDLMQLLGEYPDSKRPTARLRILTTPLRSEKYRSAAKEELIKRVCAELLGLSDCNQRDKGKASEQIASLSHGCDRPLSA